RSRGPPASPRAPCSSPSALLLGGIRRLPTRRARPGAGTVRRRPRLLRITGLAPRHGRASLDGLAVGGRAFGLWRPRRRTRARRRGARARTGTGTSGRPRAGVVTRDRARAVLAGARRRTRPSCRDDSHGTRGRTSELPRPRTILRRSLRRRAPA